MEIVANDEDSSSRAPNTLSYPRSNLDTHELDDWIRIQFQCNPTVDTVQCVPTLTLLNSLSPLHHSPSFQQIVPSYTEDQVLFQCQSKWLEILEHHFEQDSFGGCIKFLPCSSLNQAFMNASEQSGKLFRNLCEANQYSAEPTISSLQNGLQKFTREAKARILLKNRDNSWCYLERKKKNEIRKFCDKLKDSYKLLYESSVENTSPFVYYTSSLVATLKDMIAQTVMSWNTIKNTVLEDQESDYDDDVEKSLNLYMNEILAANNKRNETHVRNAFDNGDILYRKKIEITIQTADQLDETSDKDIVTHVTAYYQECLKEINTVMESDSLCSNSEQLKIELNGKGQELKDYGRHLLKMEIQKRRKALNLDFANEAKNVVENLLIKHGLKRVDKKGLSRACIAFQKQIAAQSF